MMIDSRQTPSGPVRAHNQMYNHFATLASLRATLGGALRPRATTPAHLAAMASMDARVRGTSHGVRLRAPGPLRLHLIDHAPASSTPFGGRRRPERTPSRTP